jgi:L-lactate dehydrogenase complex protein LldE
MEKRTYPDPSSKVYFFGTCLVDAAYPDAGMAAIKLLESHGVEAVFPQDQSCCGQPAYNSGFVSEARAVARRQIRVFSKPYPSWCPPDPVPA